MSYVVAAKVGFETEMLDTNSRDAKNVNAFPCVCMRIVYHMQIFYCAGAAGAGIAGRIWIDCAVTLPSEFDEPWTEI